MDMEVGEHQRLSLGKARYHYTTRLSLNKGFVLLQYL